MCSQQTQDTTTWRGWEFVHTCCSAISTRSQPRRRDARRFEVETAIFEAEDFTDTELVLREALDRGASTVLACGVFGRGLTNSRISYCSQRLVSTADVRLLDEQQEVRLARPTELVAQPGELIRLYQWAAKPTGRPPYYPLAGATLHTGPALGISNVAVSRRVTVESADGFVLVTRIFGSGLQAATYLRDHPPA
ncbi:MAG: hypothetical protein WKH64_11060 [Chloroflexia bacterium]